MAENKKKDGWDKFQICINFSAIVVIAGVGLFVNSSLKSREVNVKYVEMAVDILRAKPDESQKNLRGWAINLINTYSKVPLPVEAQQELKTNSLPKGAVLTDENGSAITDEKGNAILIQ